jgi:hypothetical protein
VDAINDPEFSNGQLRVDGSNADVQDALRNSGYAEIKLSGFACLWGE